MDDGSEVMVTILDDDGAHRPFHLARRDKAGTGSWGPPERGYVTYDLDVETDTGEVEVRDYGR